MFNPRTVASHWHGGQWSELYAFASSGHISKDLLWEIRHTYNRVSHRNRMGRAARELRTLYRYLSKRINK